MKGTIKNKGEIERLFHEGRRSSSSAAIVLAIKSDDIAPGKCAFVAGKKLGCAPLRNRCKRVMREVAREIGAPWKSFDVIFIARKKIACMDHDKAVSMVKKQLCELGVI